MKLLGLTGLPRSGKDTTANWLVAHKGYHRMAFADVLKLAGAVLLNQPLSHLHGEEGYDREQVMPEWGFSIRKFLRYMGTEVVREFHPDFWVIRLNMEVERHITQCQLLRVVPSIVITDVRFPNEQKWLYANRGTLIEIQRPGATGSDHQSDQPLTLREKDIRVLNDNRIEHLYSKLKEFSAAFNW